MITDKILIFKLRIAAILLVAAGYGWAGGHFIPMDSPLYFYFFQFIILLILLTLSVGFFSTQVADRQMRSPSRWGIIGLNVFTTISLIINIANVIHGFDKADHNAFGSHNTLADLVPIGIIMVGDIVWLVALVSANRMNKKLV